MQVRSWAARDTRTRPSPRRPADLQYCSNHCTTARAQGSAGRVTDEATMRSSPFTKRASPWGRGRDHAYGQVSRQVTHSLWTHMRKPATCRQVRYPQVIHSFLHGGEESAAHLGRAHRGHRRHLPRGPRGPASGRRGRRPPSGPASPAAGRRGRSPPPGPDGPASGTGAAGGRRLRSQLQPLDTGPRRGGATGFPLTHGCPARAGLLLLDLGSIARRE